MSDKARALAEVAHRGQEYAGRSYVEAHVSAVVQVLRDFGFEGPYIEAGWLHDVVEDTPIGILRIESDFGDEVADIVHACTGYGHNRKARNRSIYRKLARYPAAAPVKLADRIANVEASAPRGSHRSMYLKEAAEFERAVRPHVPAEMWDRLERALAHGLSQYAVSRLRGARDRDGGYAGDSTEIEAPLRSSASPGRTK